MSRASSIEVLGTSTRVIEDGPEESLEAIVLLHGNPGSADDWTLVRGALAEVGRVIAFDLPGFGEATRRADWDYSPTGYVRFIGAAIDALGLERVHLVMHDLGGLGQLWGAGHADRFASAVLIDTGNLIEYEWHWFARAYRVPVVGELMVALTTPWAFRFFLARLNQPARPLPADVLARMAAQNDRGSRRAAMNFYRGMPAGAMGLLAEVVRPLDRPALVIWGRHDTFIPHTQAERQRESYPSADVLVLDDSGHWPHVDNPERVSEALVRFLGAQL